ncbi:MAG: DUF4282 domain-containing protein [Alphaproteobacteria bacterium]|jgi:hypothetical protein|nr:DUF4282 domain-containing protein [Alphaproteobacteria bacterium]
MEGILGRFLSFDKMITGTLVKIVYYIALFVIVIAGLFFALKSLFAGQFGSFILGVVFIPLAAIYVRMICEMFIVIFRISDNLAAIRKLQEGESSSS